MDRPAAEVQWNAKMSIKVGHDSEDLLRDRQVRPAEALIPFVNGFPLRFSPSI